MSDRRHNALRTVAWKADDPLGAIVCAWRAALNEAEPGVGDEADPDLGWYGYSEFAIWDDLWPLINHNLESWVVSVRPSLDGNLALFTVATEGEWVDGWGDSHVFSVPEVPAEQGALA